jgi:hypothetical protein
MAWALETNWKPTRLTEQRADRGSHRRREGVHQADGPPPRSAPLAADWVGGPGGIAAFVKNARLAGVYG